MKASKKVFIEIIFIYLSINFYEIFSPLSLESLSYIIKKLNKGFKNKISNLRIRKLSFEAWLQSYKILRIWGKIRRFFSKKDDKVVLKY